MESVSPWRQGGWNRCRIKAIGHAFYEPSVTEAEAKAEGFEQDYTTEILEVWPDNEAATEIAALIGTR